MCIRDRYDAIILAVAGLKRLGWSDNTVTEYLEADVCIPAVGQGALAIECREDDQELLDALGKLTDDTTWKAVEAERAFLHAMDGGCQVPIAGHATVDGDTITMTGLVAAPDASIVYKETQSGTDADALGLSLIHI